MVSENCPIRSPPGQVPDFIGRWAELPPGSPRTPEQIAAWDAVTVVHGLSNDDAALDTGYTVEMRFDLTPMGYDVTQPGGDVVEWNISIYDCDWFWPINVTTLQLQPRLVAGPLGQHRLVQRGAHPRAARRDRRPRARCRTIAPEMVIPEHRREAPVIDGDLDEAVWSDPAVYTFDIRWGDDALRADLRRRGPLPRRASTSRRSTAARPSSLDPADATVKIFTAATCSTWASTCATRSSSTTPTSNRWDGFLVTVNDRADAAARTTTCWAGASPSRWAPDGDGRGPGLPADPGAPRATAQVAHAPEGRHHRRHRSAARRTTATRPSWRST